MRCAARHLRRWVGHHGPGPATRPESRVVPEIGGIFAVAVAIAIRRRTAAARRLTSTGGRRGMTVTTAMTMAMLGIAIRTSAIEREQIRIAEPRVEAVAERAVPAAGAVAEAAIRRDALDPGFAVVIVALSRLVAICVSGDATGQCQCGEGRNQTRTEHSDSPVAKSGSEPPDDDSIRPPR